MSTGYKYECKFCGMRFKQEARFMSHRCTAMKRDEQIKTPMGQAAWGYYQKWMKSQRRSIPSIETFLTSKYYTTFIKFAEFVQKVGLPDVDTFIWYMAEKKMQPVIWVNDEIYQNYIQFIDTKSDPFKEAQRTVDYMFKIADEFECDVGEIFEHLEAGDVIQMLTRRQISPWILVVSRKFKKFLQEKTRKDERLVMETIIRPDMWVKRKTKHPEVLTQMKQIVRELDL